MASVSATAPLSGYWWTRLAAAAMTSSTDGSGPNGDSLDESLNDLPSGLDNVVPGLYGAKLSRTGRKRGDRCDTVVPSAGMGGRMRGRHAGGPGPRDLRLVSHLRCGRAPRAPRAHRLRARQGTLARG